MPNENTSLECECGVIVDLPKSRNGMTAISTGNVTIFIPKASKNSSKIERSAKKQQNVDDLRGPKNSRSLDNGSCSSVTEQTGPSSKSNKYTKRLNHNRRTRSAERSDSHYTYIDSGSSILGGAIRENTIPEALYATVPELPNANTSNDANTGSHLNTQNRPQQPVYAVPSMTSPPPTYDAAIAKTRQSGLPPSYEEYLCHKYAMVSRSHTPPPPWSDTTASTNIQQARRELLASQPELREYLAQLTLAQNNLDQSSPHNQQHAAVLRDAIFLSNQQALRKQQTVRTQQRVRAMPPRSQSESRAQQQRVATMYEDGAFCMETTALQSAFDNGIAFCSLM